MQRRDFLKGCLAVSALMIVPVPDLNTYPVLYGDGIHDDTKALQAMFDLKPYICEGKLIKGQTKAILDGGTFKISRTLYLGGDTIIKNCSFNCVHEDKAVFAIKQGNE